MLPILIVDDSLEDALLAKRVLGHCKIQNPVVLLKSGQACLDYFRGARPFESRVVPCLLLLDMVMAPVSGLNVLAKMRDLPGAAGSVVVMMSGLTDLRAIHEGYQLGANTFLVKPLMADDVMQMLRAVRRLAVNRAPGGWTLSLAAPQGIAEGLAPPAKEDETPTFPNLL